MEYLPMAGHEAIAILYLSYKILSNNMQSRHWLTFSEELWGVRRYLNMNSVTKVLTLKPNCLIHFPSHIIAAVTFAFPFWPGWLLQMCHFPHTGSLLYAWPERHGNSLVTATESPSALNDFPGSLSSSQTLWFLWLGDFHLFVARYSLNLYINLHFCIYIYI